MKNSKLWHWAIEVTPGWVKKQMQHPEKADFCREKLHRKRLSVTFLPKNDEEDVLRSCQWLNRHCSAKTVCHLPARKFRDFDHLSKFVTRLRNETETEDIFVISGDAEPVGTLKDSMDLLRMLGKIDVDFQSVGVAAYPDGHPYVEDDVLDQALMEKAEIIPTGKLFIVSQLGISVDPIVKWGMRFEAKKSRVLKDNPLYVGIFGPTTVQKMMALSQRLSFSKGLKDDLARISTEEKHGLSTEQLMQKMLTSPEIHDLIDLEGFQISTFDQVRQCLSWADQQEQKWSQHFGRH